MMSGAHTLYSLLASEENEEDREVSLLVLLSEACSESPQLSELSAIFLYESFTYRSLHDFGQREPIESDKLRVSLEASRARNPLYNRIRHVIPDPLKSSLTVLI